PVPVLDRLGVVGEERRAGQARSGREQRRQGQGRDRGEAGHPHDLPKTAARPPAAAPPRTTHAGLSFFHRSTTKIAAAAVIHAGQEASAARARLTVTAAMRATALTFTL